MLVNVTPLGMNGPQADTQSFSDAQIAAASVVFDVVALPALTPLIRAGRAQDKHLITGAEVIALQAARQFERYTGVPLTPELVAEASEFSRAE
ncbi:Shikimate dehydrogenase-like protein [bioreactor metagenome]|uniref:Shikimate dehydrogenase-like protein n=1 Tax=bioreactor metagenome TaxID=1076179 RepID=A0A645IFD8_9ZZZZ